ncbi:TetR family transcriptional regulator [Halomonas denitrificans]|uniref:TetR family transcriptional regulator n=1 Tax=Halomonas TaxID=2745 RepID=UPI001A8FD45C|nr:MULTISPECIES: TetR family transcriptional regulator [Halomonas]MBN8414123.1 TetR family transcriptional regulator [Halomonas litopenaei]MBY5927185.1 TetR family transcriptional regulator [Halomonas sp. DP4Y7-2]MBY5970436.1 TetR family transcriptional regulator [Halomonas denitrificans]MBY5986094.1 TetR family transcriptional regulator [Halomonas sp. DP5Y7-2]MBY6027841.1 TetR family transcriptional regulator [Halomonas sp. DP8Y7-1]
MARRTKEEAAATRAALLDAAEEVFLERGVARASLDQISRRAGVTRGALYWHFRNKGDLFRAMLERVHLPFEDLLNNLDHAEVGHRPLEAVRLGCHTGLKQCDTPRHRRVHGILLHHCERTDDFDPLQAKAEIARETCQALLRQFQQAEERHQLRPGLSPERATDLFHYALSGLFWEWLRVPDAFSLSQRGPALVDDLITLIGSSETP